MELNEYQKQAMTTCMPSCSNIPYMLINLQGEVGELSSKIAKAIRKGQLRLDAVRSTEGAVLHHQADWRLASSQERQELTDALTGELGDVLWQLSGLCSVLGISLDDIAQTNLHKLASRQQRGVIDGNGDNR